MNPSKEKGAIDVTASISPSKSTFESKLSPKPTKKLRVFKALAEGEKIQRFTAEHDLHDHCLPSTISALEDCYQIKINRKIIEVPGYAGSTARVALYWLDPEQRKQARELLAVIK